LIIKDDFFDQIIDKDGVMTTTSFV